MTSITASLCQRAKAGEQAAYNQLFALHQDRAMLFIRARLGPELRQSVESRDVLQEAYLAAHKGFGQFEHTDDGAFLRWLCRIIENRLRDWHDYVKARKRQPAPLPPSDPTGPITALDRTEQRERLLSALDRLEPDDRTVLLLRYFEGLSSEAAGEIMGRSAGAVRKLTVRALEHLGKELKQGSHGTRRSD